MIPPIPTTECSDKASLWYFSKIIYTQPIRLMMEVYRLYLYRSHLIKYHILPLLPHRKINDYNLSLECNKSLKCK